MHSAFCSCEIYRFSSCSKSVLRDFCMSRILGVSIKFWEVNVYFLESRWSGLLRKNTWCEGDSKVKFQSWAIDTSVDIGCLYRFSLLLSIRNNWNIIRSWYYMNLCSLQLDFFSQWIWKISKWIKLLVKNKKNDCRSDLSWCINKQGHCETRSLHFFWIPKQIWGFPGGSVFKKKKKNLPANAGGMGLSPDSRRSHILWRNKPVSRNYWACTPKPMLRNKGSDHGERPMCNN